MNVLPKSPKDTFIRGTKYRGYRLGLKKIILVTLIGVPNGVSVTKTC